VIKCQLSQIVYISLIFNPSAAPPRPNRPRPDDGVKLRLVASTPTYAFPVSLARFCQKYNEAARRKRKFSKHKSLGAYFVVKAGKVEFVGQEKGKC